MRKSIWLIAGALLLTVFAWKESASALTFEDLLPGGGTGEVVSTHNGMWVGTSNGNALVFSQETGLILIPGIGDGTFSSATATHNRYVALFRATFEEGDSAASIRVPTTGKVVNFYSDDGSACYFYAIFDGLAGGWCGNDPMQYGITGRVTEGGQPEKTIIGPFPEGTYSFVTAMAASGAILYGDRNGHEEWGHFDGVTLTPLGSLSTLPGRVCRPTAVSGNIVVGTCEGDDGIPYATRLVLTDPISSSVMENLGALAPGQSTVASDVDDDGVIVGQNISSTETKSVMWNPGDTSPTDLSIDLGGGDSGANGTDDGETTGGGDVGGGGGGGFVLQGSSRVLNAGVVVPQGSAFLNSVGGGFLAQGSHSRVISNGIITRPSPHDLDNTSRSAQSFGGAAVIGERHAYLHQDGDVIDIGTLGFSSEGRAIHRGNVGGTTGPVGGETHPAIWQAEPCPTEPEEGCEQAARGVLKMKNSPKDYRDSLVVQMRGLPSATQSQFGNPMSETGYDICVYNASDSLLTGLRTLPGPNWKPVKQVGYRLAVGRPRGVKMRTSFVGSVANETKFSSSNRGARLPDPTLGAVAGPITAQVIALDGSGCREVVFENDMVVTNDTVRLIARRR